MIYLLEANQKPSIERCNCGNLAQPHIICEGVYDTRSFDEESYHDVSIYRVFRCPACQKISVVRYVSYGNQAEYLDNLDDGYPLSYAYEKHLLFSPPKPKHRAIPSAISDISAQAEAVVHTSARASLILCRAVLEEICRDHSIPETTRNKKGKVIFIGLVDKLKTLFKQKELTNDLQDIIDGIRLLGNKGAHSPQDLFSNNNISVKEVEMLLGLIDYVLEQLYVDKARAKEATKQLNELKKKLLCK